MEIRVSAKHISKDGDVYYSHKTVIHSTFIMKTCNYLSGDGYFSNLCVILIQNY